MSMRKGQKRQDKDFVIREKMSLLRDFGIVNSKNRNTYVEMYEKEINNMRPTDKIENVTDRLTQTIICRAV